MKKIFLTYSITVVFISLGIVNAKAQQTLKVGINPTTVTNSAVLDVEATNKGALLPRVALTGTTDATTIANPANALTIFNTATAGTAPNNVIPGYYYWESATNHWVRLNDYEPYNGIALYPSRRVGLGGKLEENTTIFYNEKSLTFLSGVEGNAFPGSKSMGFSKAGLRLRYNDGGGPDASGASYLSIQNTRTENLIELEAGTVYDGAYTGIKSIFSTPPESWLIRTGGQFGALDDQAIGDHTTQVGLIAKGSYTGANTVKVTKTTGGHFESKNLSLANTANYAIYAKASGIRPVALFADSGAVVINELNSSATPAAGRPVVADASGKLMIGTSSPDAWLTTGNAGTNPTNNFLGTTDAQDLSIRTNNNENVRINSNGYVGIGTVPTYKLEVKNTVAAGQTVPDAIAIFQSRTSTYGTSNEGSNAEIQVVGYNGSNNRGVSLGIGKPSIYGEHDNGYLNLGSTGSIWSNTSGIFKFSNKQGVTLNGSGYPGVEFYNDRSDNQDAYTFYSAVPTLNGALMRIKAAATAGNGNLLSVEGGQTGATVVIDKNGKLGLGTFTPNSTLQVNGSVSASIVGVTADYTLTDLDYTVICRGTATIALTLPDPALCKGRIYVIINNTPNSVTTSRSFEVSSDPSGNLLYLSAIPRAGSAIGSITPHLGNKYTLQSDGNVWVMISN